MAYLKVKVKKADLNTKPLLGDLAHLILKHSCLDETAAF